MDVERIEARFASLQREIDALNGMIDTERGVVKAQFLKVGDPAAPQIIRVSEGGGLALGNNGSWEVIDAVTEDISHTGDTDVTTLRTSVVPADRMGPNGILRIAASFRGMGAGTHSFYIYFGGTLITYRAWAGTTLMLDIPPKYIWNQGAVDAQSGSIVDPYLHAKTGEAPLAMSKDTAQDVDIDFKVANSVAGDTGYLHFVQVEVCYRD